MEERSAIKKRKRIAMKEMFIKICMGVLGLSFTLGALAQEKIIVLNEGNWQSDNGKMSYFEDGNIVSNQWFRDVNKQKLGDTPNDIIQINDGLLAIAINWSNIVQFITPEGKAVAATEDIPNNRRLATDGRYVYVTSYGHECATIDGFQMFEKGFVAKIDTETFKVVKAVEVSYEPEGIAIYKGHLFVANTGGYAFQESHDYERTVSIIDTETMNVVKTLDTGCINLYGEMAQSGKFLCINSGGDNYEIAPCSMILDCEKALKGESGSVVTMPYAATYNTVSRDGEILAIGSRFSYLTGEYNFDQITINPEEVMESNGARGITHSLPGTMKSDIGKMTSPYSIYVNPYTGFLYATDAGSYASGGKLYQWSADGELLGKHTVYINPSHLLALPPDGHFTGIDAIEMEKPVTDGRIFDLSGRALRSADNGQMYIKGGKKYIKN